MLDDIEKQIQEEKTMTHTPFTQAEFEARYNVLLDKRVPDGDDSNKKVSTFIARIDEQILAYVDDNSPSFDSTDITAYQNTQINKAAMMQAMYVLDQGDFSFMSGYDPSTNTKLSENEKTSLMICQQAKNLLNGTVIDRGL